MCCGHYCIGEGRFDVRLLLERSHIAPKRFEHRLMTIGMLRGATCEATWEMVRIVPKGAVLTISRFDERVHLYTTQV